MKKNYLFLCTLILSVVLVQAQDYSGLGPEPFPQAQLKKAEKPVQYKQKAYGDTLYYEDFDSSGTGGFPQGWTTADLSGNSFNWIWSNAAPGGQYSTGIGSLQSTTSTNGFLSLPLDFYNTPIPTGGPLSADSYVSSPAISISPRTSVSLEFQQYYRYCCSITNDWVVEVSSDGVSWTAFDNKMGRSQSAVTPNAESLSFDVSSVLGNQTTAYIRFRVSGASHYFFMVDDILLTEGYSNALSIEEYTINFGDTFLYKPLLTMFPWNCDYSISSDFIAMNQGANTQTGINGISRLFHDSTLSGSPGNGLRSTLNDFGKPSLLSSELDTLSVDMPYYHFGQHGYYRIETWVESDSINQTPINAHFEYPIVLTDYVFARDRNNFAGGGGVSAEQYVAGGNDGDRLGVLYTIGKDKNNASTVLADRVDEISIFVENDPQNIGATIAPRIWEFDASQPSLNAAIKSPPIGSSPFVSIIDSSHLGKWVDLLLVPPAYLNVNAQYLVGWEQIGGAATGNHFRAGRDRSMEPFSPDVTNFIFINDSTPSWGWIRSVAGVRLYAWGCRLITSLEKNANETSLSMSPNPTTGQFRLQLENAASANYQLKVRNALGQVVLEKPISGTALKNYEVDLSSQEKGLYFLSLESDKERWVEKLLLQ